MVKRNRRRFRQGGGVVYDSTRAVYDADSGTVVVKEKGRHKKPQSLAHTTGDAALDVWLEERRAERPAPRVWEDEAPF